MISEKGNVITYNGEVAFKEIREELKLPVQFVVIQIQKFY